MKLSVGRVACIGVALILLVIAFQSIFSNSTTLNSFEALLMLIKPETGRELTQDEIQSGHFRNLKIHVYGLSCISCSGAVFYGVVNVKGIVNADIRTGKSCIIYDSREVTKKEILTSVVFNAGVYMATGESEAVIQREADAKC